MQSATSIESISAAYMSENQSRKSTGLFSSSWVITLTATLIGVFVALYLNEWVSRGKLRDQKSVATKNMIAEISANEESLIKTVKKHREVYEVMSFLGTHVNEEESLIAPADTVRALRAKYPFTFAFSDSSLVSPGVYLYNGEINLDLSFPHLELTNISWVSVKNSGIVSTLEFSCLMYLEKVDKITSEVLEQNEDLLDYFIGLREAGVGNENLLRHLKLLLDYEESLLGIYAQREDEMKSCR